MPLRRPVAHLVTAVLTAGSFSVLSVSPAQAADSWTVPRNARIVVKGHGYGHGHGMSQYGAEGAARAGLGFKKIAKFYYPGTTWGSAAGSIAVLITADTSRDVVVLARAGLKVTDLGDGSTETLPDNGATRWRLTPASGGRTEVSYRKDGAWHRHRTLAGLGELSAGKKPVTLVLPTGQRAYRGRLRSAAPTPGGTERDTVNVLPLDSYLRGVVPLEMPALWSPAAVQTQAVAARTYAAYERAHPRTSYYDICDTTSCQVYGGADAEHPASDDAVAFTAGQVLLAGGQPAFTQFSASSGGWTSAGSMPYLVAQADPYDDWAGNPVHDWQVTFSDNALEKRFGSIGNLTRIVVVERDGNGQWGGRVVSLKLVGGKGSVTVSGDTARSVLGLRSTWFTFRVRAL